MLLVTGSYTTYQPKGSTALRFASVIANSSLKDSRDFSVLANLVNSSSNFSGTNLFKHSKTLSGDSSNNFPQEVSPRALITF
jgi:hypothetical protein